MTLEQARAWDAADRLAPLRERFALPDGVIYLDGNSLGPLPLAARAALARVTDAEWGEGLIRSWNDAGWIGAQQRIGGKIAGLIGAAPGEVTVADSTSVNLFKLAAAALAARPGRRVVVTEPGDFPTDRYMLQGLARLLPGVEVRAVSGDQLAAALSDDVALLLLSHVHYKTAARRDMAGLTAAAHAVGALALWDLSHSAGAIAVDLNGAGADLAVGCGYKFLNGGPGAPAFLFVAARHQAELVSPLTGWFGHAAPFDFAEDYRPAPGIGRFLCGTPPMLSLTALEVGVDLAREAPMAEVEAKSAAQCAFFIAAVEERRGGFGLTLASPRQPRSRGSHVAFAHAEGYRIMQELIARNVIGDFREPDIMRFGITPLYLRFEDLWRAAETLYEVVSTGAWRRHSPREAGRVT